MPATYWLPLPELHAPARVEHLHAAFSRWFDQPEGRCNGSEAEAIGPRHHDTVKPYRLAPMSQHNSQWGAEISVLTEGAFRALERQITGRSVVRLDTAETPVGVPAVVSGESWDDLAHWRGDTGWRVEFLTPFTARTGSRSSPFPSPPVVLRAATEAWAAFSGRDPIKIPPVAHRHLWVSEVDVSTTTYSLNGHRHPGALGAVTYRADDDEVARSASALFRLAHYCGMGSFRGKGMGVVSVKAMPPIRSR